jgi:hypothetical protein
MLKMHFIGFIPPELFSIIVTSASFGRTDNAVAFIQF